MVFLTLCFYTIFLRDFERGFGLVRKIDICIQSSRFQANLGVVICGDQDTVVLRVSELSMQVFEGDQCDHGPEDKHEPYMNPIR